MHSVILPDNEEPKSHLLACARWYIRNVCIMGSPLKFGAKSCMNLFLTIHFFLHPLSIQELSFVTTSCLRMARVFMFPYLSSSSIITLIVILSYNFCIHSIKVFVYVILASVNFKFPLYVKHTIVHHISTLHEIPCHCQIEVLLLYLTMST